MGVGNSRNLPKVLIERLANYRLTSSKSPPTSQFEDVADAEDFEALTQLLEQTFCYFDGVRDWGVRLRSG